MGLLLLPEIVYAVNLLLLLCNGSVGGVAAAKV